MRDFVYDDVQPITCDFVPDDINGTTVYVVPLQASEKMNNCKGIDLGGMAKLVKASRSRKGQDYYTLVQEAIVVQIQNVQTLQTLGLTDWNSSEKKVQ